METSLSPFDKDTARYRSDAEKYRFRQKLFGTDRVYPMWVADMEFEASDAIKEALVQRVEHGVYGYAMPERELFETASAWLLKRHGLEVAFEMIHASPSIMTTMSAAIEAFSEKGEGVTTFVPVYSPFMEVVETQDRHLHTVELLNTAHRFEIDFDALEQALGQSRILLLCNPHNPVGRVWQEAELRQIAQLCQKHDVTIISDDAHCDLVMPGFTYRSITTISDDAKERTVTLFGPGKGFNISGLAATLFFTHNPKRLKAMEKVFKARHIVAGQLMGYHAIKAAYGKSEAWLEDLLVYLDRNLEYAVEKINAMEGLQVYKSEGTYLLWLDCRGMGLKDMKLKKFFIEEAGLGLSLGRLFGPGGSGFMRMNCAVPFANLQEAVGQIEKALQQRKI